MAYQRLRQLLLETVQCLSQNKNIVMDRRFCHLFQSERGENCRSILHADCDCQRAPMEQTAEQA